MSDLDSNDQLVDRLNVDVEQLYAICQENIPSLICTMEMIIKDIEQIENN